MTPPDPLTRRSFLTRLGKTGLAVAVLGFGAACSDESVPSVGEPTATTRATSTTTGRPTTATSTPTAPATTLGSVAELGPVEWARAVLGNVSAYVLVRSGEAAVVDTGTPGSAPSIADTLADLGIDWSAVGHLILTHSHADHIGSLTEVMANASAAAGYAGQEDIPRIEAPRDLIAVGDGDQVFGLDIIATPGHTPGHISVLDPVARLLVAGDALNGAAGGVAGANPNFSADMATANESARKLAGLEIETMVFGHGEPLLTGAGQALRTLVADL